MFHKYTFQPSLIWTAGNPVDTFEDRVSITTKSEEKAWRKLPRPGIGRVWLLVNIDGEEIAPRERHGGRHHA